MGVIFFNKAEARKSKKEKLLINDNWKAEYYDNVYRMQKSEELDDCLERIPFLKQFAIQYEQLPKVYRYLMKKTVGYVAPRSYITFSEHRINEYMGYDFTKGAKYITAVHINKLLKKAEKDGDLWKL